MTHGYGAISARFPALRWDSVPIVLAILLLAGLAWLDVYSRSQDMSAVSMNSIETIPDPRGFWVDAALFLPMWTVMMGAMMLPAVTPLVLAFSTVYRRQHAEGGPHVPTWVFLAGYTLVWAISGVPGYLAKEGLESLAAQTTSVQSAAPVVGGLVLVGAGLYQLTSFKERCLAHCRTLMGFIVNDWRDGYSGALSMGVHHGLYCLGCCWALMAVMFPMGIMNLAWMGGLAVLIFAEKMAPRGELVARVSGLGLVAAGISLAAGLL